MNSFESKIQKLEEIVKKMESHDLSLDEAIALFQEGIQLSRECQKELEQAELKVQKLLGFDSNQNPLLEPFAHEAVDVSNTE